MHIRLNITAEGFSEERFVNDLLRPHLLNYGVYVEVRKVLSSGKKNLRGGMTSYPKLKMDVRQWIKESPDVYHTTLIDFYGLPDDFPGYKNAKLNTNPNKNIELVEEAFANDIAKDINFHRFIPYIQLHEYETLLFSDPEKMESVLRLDYPNLKNGCFQKILEDVNNPEEINDGSDTAPSKRIAAHCPGYNKIIDGINIIDKIGLPKIRKECPHFDSWLTKLEGLKDT